MMFHTTEAVAFPLLFLLISAFNCEAFYSPIHWPSKTFSSCSRSLPERLPSLSLQKGWIDNQDDDKDDPVTRDALNRDLLGMEPKVKRKRKGKGYKPLDNRDHLPFSVIAENPDNAYKTRFQKAKEEEQRKKNKVSQSKRTDLDRQMLAATRREIKKGTKGKKDSTAPSRLVQRGSSKESNADENKSMMTVLGEFELDKSTTSGDIIVLGEKEFRVETARCQYKYAGGQR